LWVSATSYAAEFASIGERLAFYLRSGRGMSPVELDPYFATSKTAYSKAIEAPLYAIAALWTFSLVIHFFNLALFERF